MLQHNLFYTAAHEKLEYAILREFHQFIDDWNYTPVYVQNKRVHVVVTKNQYATNNIVAQKILSLILGLVVEPTTWTLLFCRYTVNEMEM